MLPNTPLTFQSKDHSISRTRVVTNDMIEEVMAFLENEPDYWKESEQELVVALRKMPRNNRERVGGGTVEAHSKVNPSLAFGVEIESREQR